MAPSRALSQFYRSALSCHSSNHYIPALHRPTIACDRVGTFTKAQPTFNYSTAAALEPPPHLSAAERAIFDKINTHLTPSKLEVEDISGGCGSMYGLDIVSQQFKGLTVVKQHKLVNEVLKEEIAGWHGLQLKTKAQ